MNSKYRYFVPLAFFVLLFLIVSVASFYFLPEGILKEVNVDKDVSDNTSFLMNVFSVLTRNVIVVFFFWKSSCDKNKPFYSTHGIFWCRINDYCQRNNIRYVVVFRSQ